MKRVFYYLFGVLGLCLFNACSDDDKGPGSLPPSKGEEAVEKIVSVLEEHEEVSDFVDVLKKANVADVTTEKLTVFAVRNSEASVMRSVSGVLDTASVKRHIALGSYPKSELTDGRELTSVSGDKLYIARQGDNVYVNGVQIEGEAIPAGNSYVYVVPEVIEEQEQPVTVYTSTICVMAVSEKETTKPLEGVSITVWPTEDGDTLGTWQTDTEGKITLTHTCQAISYKIYKEGYSYEEDGFLLGVDDNGNLAHVDINGDGLLNNDDRVGDSYAFGLYYDAEDSKNKSKTVYMISDETVVTPGVDEITQMWHQAILTYLGENKYLEALLATGYGGFGYGNVVGLSDRYWELAYNTLQQGEAYLVLLDEMGEKESELAYTIAIEMALVRTHLAGYYGKLVSGNVEIPLEQLVADLEMMVERVPASDKGAVELMLAKVYLCMERWQDAAMYVKRIVDSSVYSLSADPTSIGEEEIILGGYDDLSGMSEGKLHPLLYREVLLMQVLASHKIGNEMEALQALNMLAAYFGMAMTDVVSLDFVMQLNRMSLQGTGELYPYFRFWNSPTGVEGFIAPKNYLLPIPQKAIDLWGVTQNPGY